MTRKIFALLFIALAYSVSAWAQPQPIRVTPIDPAGTAVYPFGTIAVGTSSAGVRVGPFGCYVSTSDPTFTNAQIHPCSQATDGYIRVRAKLVDSLGDPLSLAIDPTHGGAVSADGPQQMLEAQAFGANPTGVSAGLAVRGIANRAGVAFTLGGHPNIITREATIADADGAQTGALISTDISAGTKIITTFSKVTCSNANTVNVSYRLAYSTSTTLPTASVTGVAGVVDSQPGIPPGGGSTVGNGGSDIGVGGDGEDLRFTIDDPVSGSCRIVVKYFTIPS